MFPVHAEEGTVLCSPAFLPRLRKQGYLQCFLCILAHVPTLDKITIKCHATELGWFSLQSGGPFFLLIWLLGLWLIIVYFPPEHQHLVAAGDRLSGAHLPHLLLPVGTESSHIQFPRWCIVFPYSGYWLLCLGMKKFPLPLNRQRCCSLFRGQLLRACGTCSLPLTTSLPFGHAFPSARSAAASRHRRQGHGHPCVWLGSIAPPAVTKKKNVMVVKSFWNLKHTTDCLNQIKALPVELFRQLHSKAEGSVWLWNCNWA